MSGGYFTLTVFVTKSSSNQSVNSPKFYILYPSRMFWCECRSLGDIRRTDVRLLLNVMEPGGTAFVAQNTKKKTFEKHNSNVSFHKS